MRFQMACLAVAISCFIGSLVNAENLGAKSSPSAAKRPNIVWIMSEDNSKHYLKLFDEHGADTPNIRQLATNGIVFNNAFSNAPVCSVARTTLITSVYAPRLCTQFHRRIKLANMPESWAMFPKYLRDAGYYTTNNSKKDYNAVEQKGVWDNSSNKAHWKNRSEGQPFFHVQTYGDSHEGRLHFKKAFVDPSNLTTDQDSVFVHPYHPSTELFQFTHAFYHDRIKIIDGLVGKLVDQLKQRGELEDTFIFYFGDHGGVLARGKGYAYETGLHVPLVIRVPKNFKHLSPLVAGSRTDAFVEFVDFGPTVLNLAGVKVPDHVNGRPYLGQDVSVDDLSSRTEAFGYADRMDEKYDLVRTLRRGDLKYIRNFQAIYPDGLQNNYRYLNLGWQQWRDMYAKGELTPVQAAFFQPRPAEQLFDLRSDPYETQNLANDPGFANELRELRSALTERMKSMPDLSMFPESYLVNEAVQNPIEFGQKNQKRIASLIETANLALLPAEAALPKLKSAAQHDDFAHRYWAYSVCSIFGEGAASLAELAKKSASSDPDAMVRLRAAEFLGIIKQQDPMPTIREIVTQTESSTEALVALQSLVYFKDGPFDYDTTLDTSTIKALDEQTVRRVAYLDNMSPEEFKKWQRELRKKSRK